MTLRVSIFALLVSMCLALPFSAIAAEPTHPDSAPAPIDIVTVKDGSIIYGEVFEMFEVSYQDKGDTVPRKG